MRLRIGRPVSILVLAAALSLVLPAGKAGAQCRGGQQMTTTGQQNTLTTGLRQQQLNALLATLQQQAQLQGVTLAAVRQQRLNAVLAALQQQQLAAAAQQQAILAGGR